MITNDRQYRIAKAQIEKFKEALEGSQDSNDPDVDPIIQQAGRDAIEYQLRQLAESVQEYEELKEGRIAIASVSRLSDLPLVLIKARIANKLTQLELAERLGLKEQQIQRYESERYESVSLKTLVRIAEQLGVQLTGEVQLRDLSPSEESVTSKYPFKQMFQRKWFPDFNGSFVDAVKSSDKLLEKFFDVAGISEAQPVFNRRSLRLASKFNEFALNAWYARVLIKAQDQDLEVVFQRENITDNWLRALTLLSILPDGPSRACQHLKDIGIRIVIEPHLEGTYLDGAALLLDNLYPVIALTLRHDRLDNFWFVLLHEIAHVKLHLGFHVTLIFDDLDVDVDGIESEADRFALNCLIADEVWRKSLVRFSPSEKTIVNQAKNLNIHPALVAGRIRRETGRYYEFNNLIGQGEVRKHFREDF